MVEETVIKLQNEMVQLKEKIIKAETLLSEHDRRISNVDKKIDTIVTKLDKILETMALENRQIEQRLTEAKVDTKNIYWFMGIAITMTGLIFSIVDRFLK
ncbi:MAG: hypothetical protein QXT97_02490 [Candidatus Diapherotrites archaeon]